MIALPNRFSRLLMFLACISLAIAGCSGGPPKPVVGSVTGKVTLGGSPFSEGRVVFKDSTIAIEAVAELKSDGTFEVVTPDGGLQVGKYDVAVQPPPPPSIDPAEAAKGVTSPPDTSKIPKIYREFATSGFKATVSEGKNELNFEMKP